MKNSITFSIHTLGCKVNSYESNIVVEKCLEQGFEKVEFGQTSDISIINTCAVTEESARKSKQYARRVKRQNPDCVLVVIGCFSQICDDGSLDFADIVLGTKNKSKIVSYILEFLQNRRKIIDVSDISSDNFFEKMISDKDDHIRATVKIQDGCDNFCSYCIIPYARGRIRSKDINEAYEEISALVKSGYKEIVLAGIHITSYGLDGKDYDLIDLLEKIDCIDGLERIRLGSVDPKFITYDNVERLKRIKRLCPHFHLSLQSGCDSVLKRMNRKYTVEDFVNSTEFLKQNFENLALTSDIIVGFCGETDSEFKETCELVAKIGFSKIHLFPFSPRKGTAAYKMEDLGNSIKSERMKIIGDIERRLEFSYKSGLIGKTFQVLSEKCLNGFSEGFTPNYIKVKFRGNRINTIEDVLITGVDGDCCVGEVLNKGKEIKV